MFDRLFNNIGLKLISIIIAIALWFIVLGAKNIEITKEIPLEIEPPVDLIIANEIPSYVTFKLLGPKAFLRSIQSRGDRIKVDLSKAKPGVTTYRIYSDAISMPLGVKVLSITPSTISPKLDKLKRKKVPLRLTTVGKLPKNLKLGRAIVKPSSVWIKGPARTVRSIRSLSTAPVNLSEIEEPFESEVMVNIPKKNVFLDIDNPPVAVIDVIPESSNYKINNVSVVVSTPYNYKTKPSSVSLIVKTDKRLHKVSRVSAKDVVVYLDMDKYKPGKYRLKPLVRLPRGMKLLRMQPEKVRVFITKK